MRFCSRSFRALLRRNLIYRKRKPVSSLLELLLPIGFICILVAIKLAVKNTDGFFPETVEPSFPPNKESAIPFSFTDYVTAIQAERKCKSNGRGFSITGMTSVNWQVPFVKCDSRRCERDGQDARDELCEFSILAVAPEMENDELSTERVKRFMDYVFTRYPQLNTVNENDEPNVVPGKFAMVQAFSSDAEMSKYVQESDYGKAGSPKISLGVVFSSKDQKGNDYDYTIRLNSTNVNNPEEAARLALTTPSTGKLFESFQKTDDNSCEGIDGTPYLGILGSSCTGQYIYNGAITIQRLVGDWILDDSGAKGAGYAVSDGGVQFVSFPTREYEEDGFYAAIESR